MERVLMLMTVQGAMGAFDAIYHHEITERLAWRPTAARELAIHAVRDAFYAVLFIAFAWAEWHGLWAIAFAILMASEIGVTLVDFVIEDKTRDLPASERVTHALLAINFGVILAVLIPEFARWLALPTAVVPASHGAWSWISTAIGAGAVIDAVRDGTRARAIRRKEEAPGPCLASVLPGRQSILITGAPDSWARGSPRHWRMPATRSPC